MSAIDTAGRTYGALALSGDSWVMVGLEPHAAIKLKALFPQIPKAHGGPFRFVASPERAADLEWFESRYPLRMSPNDRSLLRAAASRSREIAAELERIKLGDYQAPAFARLRAGQSVREHQAAAAAILQRVGGLLVGDEVGEGKTYTTGACCLLPMALPATIVCQPHLKGQWADKLRQFTDLKVEILRTTRAYAPPPCDVRIIGYTQLAGWMDVLEAMPSGLVAFDEMQELRAGGRTAKGEAALRLVAAAVYRLGLTATPIYNYGDEIWEVMRYLRPEVLGEREDFIREWCHPAGVGKWRVRDPKALGAHLRDVNAFTRKVKDRSGRPNVVVQSVNHDTGTLDQIEAAARQLAETASRGTFVQRGEATRQLDLKVRHATGVAKAPYVAAVARILVEGGEPILLFGWHRDVYDIWLDRLADLEPAMFTGSETGAAKQRSLDAFLSGQTDILILSLRSGAGIDGLQHRASTLVFGELDWSPGIHHQCIGRLDREGQIAYPEPVNALYLVAEDGSDPPMMEVLGLKASEAAHIVDPSLGVQGAQGNTAAMQRLVNRYLDRRAHAVRGRAA